MKKQKAIKRRTCGAMAVHHRLLELDPNFRMRQAQLENATAMRMSLGARALRAAAAPLIIPVVVQVVYKTAAENISVAQIKSQIDVLNKDYRAKNPDKSKVPPVWKGLVSDVGTQFTLATKDPKGKPTTGITRTKTTKTSFDTDDSVKSSATGGVNAWPTDKYLNIWVCTLANGILGYAQFPGGPKKTDGVVILNTRLWHQGNGQRTLQSGKNGNARSRPLAQSAPHLGGHGRLQRHRFCRRHAECSGAKLRETEIPPCDLQ